eukprot:CAMPEP_0196656938 /NCGR_PEP_ID=MMETSP1086-20130531/20528_1 /TAXON_ID=77921 /ORGANISM="Cyanoptyche  gloeocystis , Strain SAG4.97" /LENGTH=146 /DNA_ID=CAMNT_0041989869 /DNA_START=178 /DNA_END=618 /DNA_ORIENTATION=+
MKKGFGTSQPKPPPPPPSKKASKTTWIDPSSRRNAPNLADVPQSRELENITAVKETKQGRGPSVSIPPAVLKALDPILVYSFVSALVLLLAEGLIISVESAEKLLKWDVPAWQTTLAVDYAYKAFSPTLIFFLAAASLYGVLKIRQ